MNRCALWQQRMSLKWIVGAAKCSMAIKRLCPPTLAHSKWIDGVTKFCVAIKGLWRPNAAENNRLVQNSNRSSQILLQRTSIKIAVASTARQQRKHEWHEIAKCPLQQVISSLCAKGHGDKANPIGTLPKILQRDVAMCGSLGRTQMAWRVVAWSFLSHDGRQK